MPVGVRNIYAFAFFNALSFQIILGSPMVLFAQSLGASSVVLGAIAGMTPMLVILQIPAARFVDRVGYKPFVVTGWSIRLIFVGLVAVVPFLGDRLSGGGQVALVLLLLLLFNLARGISSCGWLPWISSIIPASMRGRYLTLESAMANLASIGIFFGCAWILGGAVDPDPWRFAALFGASMLFGMVSVAFLKRIPEPEKVSIQELPPRPRLKTMWKEKAFRKLILFNIAWPLACGGSVTFMVAFLKEVEQWPDQRILIVSSVIFLGGLANQLMLSRLLDRFGSKPVLLVAAVLWIAVVTSIVLVAGGVLAASILLVCAILFGIGVSSSMMNLANIRLAMLTVPEVGRTHYFAVFSVAGGIALGLAPLMWGAVADLWGATELSVGPIRVTHYAALYGGQLIASFAMFVFAIRLHEDTDNNDFEKLMNEALSGWRIRYWLRGLFQGSPRR